MRAAGRSNSRSKNRSTAARGPAIRWPSLAGVPLNPAQPGCRRGVDGAVRDHLRTRAVLWRRLCFANAVGHPALRMASVDVFCERCGTRQPIETAPEPRKDAKKTFGRLLAAAGLTNPAVSRSGASRTSSCGCACHAAATRARNAGTKRSACARRACRSVSRSCRFGGRCSRVQVRQEPEWPTLEHEIRRPEPDLPVAGGGDGRGLREPARLRAAPSPAFEVAAISSRRRAVGRSRARARSRRSRAASSRAPEAVEPEAVELEPEPEPVAIER